MTAALALVVWWKPVRVPCSWPCNRTKGHMVQVIHAYTYGLSCSSGPCYCPWLTSLHVAHLVKISKLLFCYSVSCCQVMDVLRGGCWAWIRTGDERCVCVCVHVCLCITLCPIFPSPPWDTSHVEC